LADEQIAHSQVTIKLTFNDGFVGCVDAAFEGNAFADENTVLFAGRVHFESDLELKGVHEMVRW
jgi:hypothetical protein